MDEKFSAGFECGCQLPHGPTRFVVLTGGPGAGKTAILELARKQYCQHVVILPEAASIVFKGGFWRLPSASAQISCQRSIFCIQRELEKMSEQEKRWDLAFCDRGTLDGLAYWPESEASFFKSQNTTKQIEFDRYLAVIHLKTPSKHEGYNFQNPYRTESALEASKIDEKIYEIWKDHPNYYQVGSSHYFLDKVNAAFDLMNRFEPKCCRNNFK